MPLDRLKASLKEKIKEIDEKGIVKRKESVILEIKKCDGIKGNRYILKGEENKEYIRMNSNSYLALHLNERVKQKEEEAIKKFGVGPGAVRFISGTYEPHKALEERISKFHSREDAIIFSSAYGCVLGTLFSLIDEETFVISDELNHNCIINGIRLSKPKEKDIYKHLNVDECEEKIKNFIGKAKKVLIITDGVFSMRGDYAPLDRLQDLANKYDKEFEEEANAIIESINIIDSDLGKGMITYVRELAKKFREGIISLGLETTKSEHPIVPLIIRDTQRTKELVKYIRENGVLSTGLNFPIVPKGEELIRFQISYEHTEYDINYVLDVIKNFFSK